MQAKRFGGRGGVAVGPACAAGLPVGAAPDGADLLDCGGGFDLALHDPFDEVEIDCERTGARVVGDSAKVSSKRKLKAEVRCPASEGAGCEGKLKLTAGGKKLGKGTSTSRPARPRARRRC